MVQVVDKVYLMSVSRGATMQGRFRKDVYVNYYIIKTHRNTHLLKLDSCQVSNAVSQRQRRISNIPP